MIDPKSALLVIDMQKGSFTPATPRYDTAGVVTRINALSKHCREAGAKVIFIQHDGSRQGDFLPGAVDWEILDELVRESSDETVAKTANDSFYDSSLLPSLEAAGIERLIITGCATDFCVEATIQSALVKGFQVVVVADGHTTADRSTIRASDLVAHYNWVWNNMLPTRGRIVVRTTQEILSYT